MSDAPLLGELRRLIAIEGPITIERYMALCLGHPVHGYYRTRDPLGAAGDFTTAPEISQIFGELLGLWTAEVWHGLGRPASFRLVELGPGRGTLMADALRALRAAAPDCLAAADLHLVETSPTLRAAQSRALANAAPTWHESIDTLPAGPAIVLANEFFDALPVRQYQRTERGWCERRVGLVGDALAFGLSPEPVPEIAAQAAPGAILTLPAVALDLVRQIASRLAQEGGALAAIDYGDLYGGTADTLQAVARHRFADPLEAPGETDLTAQVDFAALARAAAGAGASVHGPVTQADFLLALGLAERAERLAARANPVQAAAVKAGAERLIDRTTRGMGNLFKVLGLTGPGGPDLPGLPRRA
ncbi:class I SAM-dependent methyltransferase [Methylobacterium nonmethylotrophicum]|uniref:Class I SAM-dependent methyltransferase n=1 Tax=Methylobacterium nonmethylotrophicum TaxID=1141884 RepID=A0A4Z0NVR7_9HYPH|nr:SAM-dependent methyltransferase [Methylobacterium nonmethylotrophicum]TGE01479.1 class I SAM-dependent methyltransferase [Methylobacterium nonmethylotrophicum]